jgi:hypothetical protein
MRAALEVADIFRRHGPAYAQAHSGHLGRVERRVMSAIALCRTAALGGHIEACDDCRHSRVAYNSCRNRHCPKCQTATREQWLRDRQADLLPVPYFHVVFTVPAEVAEIAFHNKAIVYAILFDAVAATLKTLAADPRHLGGEIGFLAILHTWGQALTHHPHIHCLVPGGALVGGNRWLACRPRFFLPVHVLSRLFRRLFLERLQAAHRAGRLRFSASLARLDDTDVFAASIRDLRRKDWIVYSKPPFGSPEHVLAYLGRYTHRVAIANSRLVSADDKGVSFRWRDYRRGNAPRVMSLAPDEFIRRFLIHTLPDGFHRIRHYGFLANGCRRARVATIRQLLPASKAPGAVDDEATAAPATTDSRPRFDPTICPCCGGRLRMVFALPAMRQARPQPYPDTS